MGDKGILSRTHASSLCTTTLFFPTPIQCSPLETSGPSFGREMSYHHLLEVDLNSGRAGDPWSVGPHTEQARGCFHPSTQKAEVPASPQTGHRFWLKVFPPSLSNKNGSQSSG